jgi:hypothetical protein
VIWWNAFEFCNAIFEPLRNLKHPESASRISMIYRYRIVPIDYTSKGMIEAAIIPAASAQGSGN